MHKLRKTQKQAAAVDFKIHCCEAGLYPVGFLYPTSRGSGAGWWLWGGLFVAKTIDFESSVEVLVDLRSLYKIDQLILIP